MTKLISLLMLSTLAQAADLTQRDRVFDHLEKNIINRITSLAEVSQSPDKTLEYDFRRTSRIYNLQKTEEGLTYDTMILIKQTNYDLDKEGKRDAAKPPAVQDRELVIRTEVIQSQSSGKLIGFAKPISNTLTDVTGSAESASLYLDGDKLVEETKTLLYGDYFAAGNTFKPGRAVTKSVYSLENGKLKNVVENTSWYVNPDTLEPTSEKKTVTSTDQEK